MTTDDWVKAWYDENLPEEKAITAYAELEQRIAEMQETIDAYTGLFQGAGLVMKRDKKRIAELEREIILLREPCYCCRERGCQSACGCRPEGMMNDD